MNLLEKVQTKLNRETQVTGSFPLTLPGSLIADHALEPKRGMKLAFISKWLHIDYKILLTGVSFVFKILY